MAETVYQNTPITYALPARNALVVTAPAGASGQIGRLADISGATVPDVPASFQAVSSGQSVTIGPFQILTHHLIMAIAGTVTFSVLQAVPHLPISGAPTDVIEMFGSGAPTNGTTGLGTAGIGSRYTDMSAGKLYINGAAKSSPAWKIVTSA